jgi:hypothetical protein
LELGGDEDELEEGDVGEDVELALDELFTEPASVASLEPTVPASLLGLVDGF